MKAINILEDIIDDKDLDAVQVLTKSIPNIRRGGQKTSFLPIYKYLSKIGINSKADYDNNQLGINIPLEYVNYIEGIKRYCPDVTKVTLTSEQYNEFIFE